MPNNPSQGHLIATPTKDLCAAWERRAQSEQECITVKTENNIYVETDKWEKELIGRLTGEPIH